MTLQQLEYITALSDYGRFVSAAEHLGISQSTLSLMVRKLEDELGLVIFDRNAHPVKPTPAGMKVIGLARSVLNGVRKINEVSVSEKETMPSRINMAMISTVASVLMPGMFRYYRTNWPEISLEVEEMQSESIGRKILQGELDMGIVNSPVRSAELLEIPLYTESFMAYVSPCEQDHSLPEIRNDELLRHPLWIVNSGVRLFDSRRMGTRKEFSYDSLYKDARVDVLVRIVDENGGMAILPETHKTLIQANQIDNLRPIVGPSPTRTISLVVRRDFIHERLLNEVVKSIKTVIPQELCCDFIRKEHISI